MRRGESGVALIAVLLMMALIGAMLAAFTAAMTSENRVKVFDRERTQAFYGAHAGLEKATSDLGLLFSASFAPTAAQVNALTTSPPSLLGISYTATSEGPGYQITFTPDGSGNPSATQRTITTGPYQGFTGLVTPYTIYVTARTPTGAEVRLLRALQTVSIPVFQFGIFSDTDLSFFAGPEFDFGGRVHTNGNLFLASGSTLTFADRVTALGEVIRTNLSNGWPTSSGYGGNVQPITTPGSYRNLATNEGSLVGTLGSALNEPTWSNLSVGTYNGNLRNGRTGARRLDLPLVTIGSAPIEMIRRPPSGESTTSTLYLQRFFSMASLRIMVSDTATAMTSLPTVTATAPVQLGATVPAWYTVNATRPRFAVSKAEAGGAHMTNPGSPLLGGFIKIEMQTTANVWQDVTQEILTLGIGANNIAVAGCADPSPNAVIRLERIRDDPSTSPGNRCGTGVTLPATDLWPNVLYDTREGDPRDNESTGETHIYLGGAMYYVELDMLNLRRWFKGLIGASGPNALNSSGYVVYFSDRRTNRSAAGAETGEFGYEDVVNPANANGLPNGALDVGEDMNGNGALDVYGKAAVAPTGLRDSAFLAYVPTTKVDPLVAKANPPLFFRRALKVVNGRAGNIIDPGLTIASENPVYVQGDFNASGGFGTHVAVAIIADAITLLSNNWNDQNSFTGPHDPSARSATETWYRFGVIAGKGPSFPHPTAGSPYQDFGTDGGVHNFLRFLEAWGSTGTHYLGSIGSFYFHRQAVGTYKCCTNVYGPGARDYQFDSEFLTPSKLPPRTPMFRDVNVVGFTPVLTVPQ